MKFSEIKATVTKSPRSIIKDVAGVSDGFISDVLNEKANKRTVSARLVKNIATDLAEDLKASEARLKKKYQI